MFLTAAVNPNFLLRGNFRMAGVFSHAVGRAVTLANDTWRPNWDESSFVVQPSADKAIALLGRLSGRITYDVETDGQHPMQCQLRCLALCDGKQTVCVPFLRRDGTRHEVFIKEKDGSVSVQNRAVWVPYFQGDALKRVLQALRRLFSRTGCHFIAQNGQFDRTVLRSVYGLEVPANGDSLVAHHIVSPYLPHGLGFLASLYTDAPFYKATDSGDSWASESDYELYFYCCRDVLATWLVYDKLEKELTELPQNAALYQHDLWQEKQAELWRTNGVKLDVEALAYFRHHYRSVAAKALAAMRTLVAKRGATKANECLDGLMEKLSAKADAEVVDDAGAVAEVFNPGSLIQLRMLLQGLGVPLSELTATGQLSTAKELLTGARKELLATNVSANDDRIALLDYLFAWRESSKVNGTYLYPEVLKDGRVHPTFSVHVTPTGRLSSQKPNFQNQPASIRGMYVPEAGNTFVYGDWDALELRLGAFLSQDALMLKNFAAHDAKTGPKPHLVNMSVLFGLPPTQAAADQHPGMYRAAKTFAYAVAYGSGKNTSFEQMREEMPDLQVGAFDIAYANYKKAYATFFKNQEETVAHGTQYGWIDSPILKRRSYYFERVFGTDSPEAAAMANFRFQSGGADVVSLANRRVVEGATTHFKQLAQVHDELLFEIAEADEAAFKADFKRLAEMNIMQKAGWGNLPVDIKAKHRWKPVQCRCPKCKKLMDVEPVKRSKKHVTWGGTCECKAKHTIEVPRELEAI